MARLKDIPLSVVADLASGMRGAHERRHECVRVVIEVDPTAPAELVASVKTALMPETSTGLVHVGSLAQGVPVRVNADSDLAIVLAGESEARSAGAARAFASIGVPCAVVVESAVEVPESGLGEGVEVIAAANADVLLQKLAGWMAEACSRDIALAVNFPFCRDAVARACVRSRSAQNAVVSLLPIGGSDLPVMGLNQALMALDLASAYGKGADAERALELAVVAAGAVCSRACARRLARSLPGLGFVVRVLVAYGATALMGTALAASHELRSRKDRSAGDLPHSKQLGVQ